MNTFGLWWNGFWFVWASWWGLTSLADLIEGDGSVIDWVSIFVQFPFAVLFAILFMKEVERRDYERRKRHEGNRN